MVGRINIRTSKRRVAVIEPIANVLVQIVVGIVGAVTGAIVTRWLEKGKRQVLQNKTTKLEAEIRDVANQAVCEDEWCEEEIDQGTKSRREIVHHNEETGESVGSFPAGEGGTTLGVENQTAVAKEKMTGWNWREVITMLAEQLPAGKVTTIELLSLRLYRRIFGRDSPVRTMLASAKKNGQE